MALRARAAAQRLELGDWALLVACAALPFLSLLGTHGAILADARSEAPIKLWVFETFWRAGIFGGRVTAGWPYPGSLNNPDPTGTIVTGLLRPVIGRAHAYNALVYLQLLANLAAMRALLRSLGLSRGASVAGAAAFGLTPVVLVYCVAGAVTDMLNLWPWLLALRAGLRSLSTGWRDGLAAGAWVGAGFVTCPYNAVVFSIMAIPLLPFTGLLRGRGAALLPARPSPWPSVLGALLAVGVGAAVVATPYAVQMRRVMDAPDSQMSAEMVASTRNVAPYPYLAPSNNDRYTAFLADYVAVGKRALITREAGSRYYRAFSPGLYLLALALYGLVPRRQRGVVAMWCAVGVFCAIASLGPFTPITGALASPTPNNALWLALQAAWPGATMLQEPFRYAIPAVVAVCIAGAFGVDALERSAGPWVGRAALLVCVGELVFLSPVPAPLPTAALAPAESSYQLAKLLPEGAIIALPYFDEGTARFVRTHFLDQLVHQRPIADEVSGFPARYLRENNYTAALLAAEKPYGKLAVTVTDPTRVDADRLRLPADGFVGIVVDRARFLNQKHYADVQALLAPWGKPVHVGHEDVYRLE